MKTCTICGESFESPRNALTCGPECKRERKRIYDRERYPTVREETIRRACDWYWENQDRKKVYDVRYRHANQDRINAYRRDLYAQKMEDESYRQAMSSSSQRYIARKRGLTGHAVRVEDMMKISRRYGGLCAYCSDLACEWDHVIPLSRGGAHQIGNLVPSCRTCNASKSTKTPSEWKVWKIRNGL